MIGRGGQGHKAAAVALRDALVQDNVPWASSIELVDTGIVVEKALNGRMAPLLPSGDDIYNRLMMRGFYSLAGVCARIGSSAIQQNRKAVQKAFMKLWQAREPSLVISFVPLGLNYLMRCSLKIACPEARLVTVVTDMETNASHTWIDTCDVTAMNHVIIVGTAVLEEQARMLGYDKQLFRSTGMLVHPAFYTTDPNETTETAPPGDIVVFFGGFAPTRTVRIVKQALCTFPELNVVVICGGNARLQRQLERKSEPRCIVEGFIPPERVRSHFRNARVILGKPGPGVASEAAVCGVPFVTEKRKVMPQEVCVLREIERTNTGMVVDTLEQLPADLFARVEQCRDALKSYHNRAVFEVSAYVQGILQET